MSRLKRFAKAIAATALAAGILAGALGAPTTSQAAGQDGQAAQARHFLFHDTGWD